MDFTSNISLLLTVAFGTLLSHRSLFLQNLVSVPCCDRGLEA